ncbi:hypothetical protein LH464_23885 [Neorhizobium sp. T786]|uniref:hypothetical protein n=1 Tax=Pseudorhizobium xiangyangii TaxID=2883104 RepID=UPI001CFF945F|nr:hypothetical protein [Neorhizobium xiangyangii]MCB5205490.1 hypothetical protein [Neorhizobium xiangyangii]
MRLSGIFPGDDLCDRSFEFSDLKTGKVVQQNNADGGRVLAGFWSDLCPLGAPYDLLPLEQVIDTNKEYLPLGESSMCLGVPILDTMEAQCMSIPISV